MEIWIIEEVVGEGNLVTLVFNNEKIAKENLEIIRNAYPENSYVLNSYVLEDH